MEHLISIGALVFAIFSWYVNFNRSDKEKNSDEASTFASVVADVRYVIKQCEGIDRKIENLETSINSINVGIAENKTNIVTLFKKYDELNERMKTIENERKN